MPQSNQPNISTPQMPHEMAAHWDRRLLYGLGAVALVATAAALFWFKPVQAPVTVEPKVIGIVEFPQQLDAKVGFKDAMEKLGYVEGESVIYEERQVVAGATMFEDIDAALTELIEDDVDLLWLSLEHQSKAAVNLTAKIGRTDVPIVFLSHFHDPVEFGIIQSYRSSGNNATGVTTDMNEIVQRTLEFFRSMDPSITVIGVFGEGFSVPPIGGAVLKTLKETAPRMGFELKEYTSTVPPPEAEAEFNRVAASIQNGDIDALFHIAGHHYVTQERGESDLAIRLGIPMFSPFEDLPNGGQFSYSDEFGVSAAQSATMVDKIFKGTMPSDIPVEYGSKTVLTLVLDRAEAAGTVFPQGMYFLAENIFESWQDFPVRWVPPEEQDKIQN
ncbi:MAG TPA: ABC transporter substrate-binding protein [Candidatus Paceibacterota bacterium]